MTCYLNVIWRLSNPHALTRRLRGILIFSRRPAPSPLKYVSLPTIYSGTMFEKIQAPSRIITVLLAPSLHLLRGNRHSSG